MVSARCFSAISRAITMDTNELESIDINALDGTDTVTVNDLTGTGVTEVNINLVATLGGSTGDGVADTVIINASSGDDLIEIVGDSNGISIFGLSAQVNIVGFETTFDHLVINGLAGDDMILGSALGAGIPFTAEGGEGSDVLVGGAGDDTLVRRRGR